jgi:hypothetical protein
MHTLCPRDRHLHRRVEYVLVSSLFSYLCGIRVLKFSTEYGSLQLSTNSSQKSRGIMRVISKSPFSHTSLDQFPYPTNTADDPRSILAPLFAVSNCSGLSVKTVITAGAPIVHPAVDIVRPMSNKVLRIVFMKKPLFQKAILHYNTLYLHCQFRAVLPKKEVVASEKCLSRNSTRIHPCIRKYSGSV